MNDYIEREAAYRFAQDQLVKETGAYSRGWNHAMNVMKSALHNNDALPAADVVARDCYDRLLSENDGLRKERPVRHGRWSEVEHGENGVLCECSVCKEWMLFYYGFVANYCPNCGARMDLKGGDGE